MRESPWLYRNPKAFPNKPYFVWDTEPPRVMFVNAIIFNQFTWFVCRSSWDPRWYPQWCRRTCDIQWCGSIQWSKYGQAQSTLDGLHVSKGLIHTGYQTNRQGSLQLCVRCISGNWTRCYVYVYISFWRCNFWINYFLSDSHTLYIL